MDSRLARRQDPRTSLCQRTLSATNKYYTMCFSVPNCPYGVELCYDCGPWDAAERVMPNYKDLSLIVVNRYEEGGSDFVLHLHYSFLDELSLPFTGCAGSH